MRLSLALALAIAVTGALSPRAPAVDDAAFTSADRFEAKLLDRLNAMRANRGLATLRRSPLLSSAAHRHSADMARNRFCGHDSATGTSFWKRISHFYGRGDGWTTWSAAENVLCHPLRLTAAAALGEWLSSPGHRANLLAPQWREVGLGAVYADPGQTRRGDVLLVTADFGVRR